MSEIADRPRPYPDRDSEPYWQALSKGILALQKCSGCGALRWPPRALCNRCKGFEAEWQPVSGEGTIVSWVRNHQVFAPAFADEVPYVVVQVRLAEQDDVLMIGGWRAEREPRSEEAVALELVRIDEEVTLPYWKPIESD